MDKLSFTPGDVIEFLASDCKSVNNIKLKGMFKMCLGYKLLIYTNVILNYDLFISCSNASVNRGNSPKDKEENVNATDRKIGYP